MVYDHSEKMRDNFVDFCKHVGLYINQTRMVGGYGLNGRLDFGSMIGAYDGEVVAIVPFWREKRDGKNYYYLSKHITKPSGVFAEWE